MYEKTIREALREKGLAYADVTKAEIVRKYKWENEELESAHMFLIGDILPQDIRLYARGGVLCRENGEWHSRAA